MGSLTAGRDPGSRDLHAAIVSSPQRTRRGRPEGEGTDASRQHHGGL